MNALEKYCISQSLRHRRDQLHQNICHHDLVAPSPDESIFMLATQPILRHKFLHFPVMFLPQLGYHQIIDLENLSALIFHQSIEKSIGELYFAQRGRLGRDKAHGSFRVK